jgi:S-disulfanyl-L-cysteine oxidoreductase SoxD
MNPNRTVLLMGLFVACGGTQPPASEPGAATDAAGSDAEPAPEAEAGSDAATAPSSFAEQVALGQELYGQKCASCHGAAGSGGEAPPVVGLSTGALPLDPPPGAKYRTTQFRTVADIATFVVGAMPPGAAGSLSEEQYWSILAFDLKANGIELESKLTPELAVTLEVPR